MLQRKGDLDREWNSHRTGVYGEAQRGNEHSFFFFVHMDKRGYRWFVEVQIYYNNASPSSFFDTHNPALL